MTTHDGSNYFNPAHTNLSRIKGESMALEQNRWFPKAERQSPGALQLYCFPFAGGSALTYQRWRQSLPNVDVLPVELPGRGTRFKEPAITSLFDLIGAITEPLRERLSGPFAFFGHSMGAAISFELARHLRTRFGLSPAHLFLSARPGPRLPETRGPTYNLPEAEFLGEIRRLNGTPAEVIESPEVMRILSPILRADFQVNQTYRYEPGEPLSCPITVFGGLDDDHVPRESLFAWREETSAVFNLQMLPGGHFFLRTSESLLLRLLSETLSKIIGDDHEYRVDGRQQALQQEPDPRPVKW
jgi:medium-chain acyl-[acyl-carrier-protein] hydrolase